MLSVCGAVEVTLGGLGQGGDGRDGWDGGGWWVYFEGIE